MLEHLVGECHVRTERVELRRAGCSTRGQQAILSGGGIATAETHDAEDEVRVVDDVSVIPALMVQTIGQQTLRLALRPLQTAHINITPCARDTSQTHERSHTTPPHEPSLARE